MDQKTVFTERLRRIDKGKQIEPEGVIGRKFQKKYEHKFGVKAQRERQSTRNAFVLLIAIALGALAMLCGRLGYFHLSKLEGLPEAFYDLQGRGVAIIVGILLAFLMAFFGLYGKGRVPALLCGCALMYFGEAAVAANATELWARIFSPEYAQAMAAQGADYVLTPAG
ncbi:MAG TPA: hypothetical protein P5036_15760 [Albidovulum sp.]|uniref:hypothetical protein n=1 Tax=Albidovulum sp. TaxID=1872424 RepID=UPI001D65EEAB|nr:hypothetical protein [Paracoccaceae bacterium]MCB2159493.1 hypothetical protein [Paracoccaceae bacterium]HPE25289.1 hypothetical protein [Albidovulum sp.]HRV64432.1 hypothetical protein [Albidovulum sp.]